MKKHLLMISIILLLPLSSLITATASTYHTGTPSAIRGKYWVKSNNAVYVYHATKNSLYLGKYKLVFNGNSTVAKKSYGSNDKVRGYRKSVNNSYKLYYNVGKKHKIIYVKKADGMIFTHHSKMNTGNIWNSNYFGYATKGTPKTVTYSGYTY